MLICQVVHDITEHKTISQKLYNKSRQNINVLINRLQIVTNEITYL